MILDSHMPCCTGAKFGRIKDGFESHSNSDKRFFYWSSKPAFLSPTRLIVL